MTIIRTTCEHCGDVEVPAWTATVTLTDAAEGYLAFSCPVCSAEGTVPADAAAVALLQAAGVSVTRMCEPADAIDEAYISRAMTLLQSLDALCSHEGLLG